MSSPSVLSLYWHKIFSHYQAGYVRLPSRSIYPCLGVPSQQRETEDRNTLSYAKRRKVEKVVKMQALREKECKEKKGITPSGVVQNDCFLFNRFKWLELSLCWNLLGFRYWPCAVFTLNASRLLLVLSAPCWTLLTTAVFYLPSFSLHFYSLKNHLCI